MAGERKSEAQDRIELAHRAGLLRIQADWLIFAAKHHLHLSDPRLLKELEVATEEGARAAKLIGPVWHVDETYVGLHASNLEEKAKELDELRQSSDYLTDVA